MPKMYPFVKKRLHFVGMPIFAIGFLLIASCAARPIVGTFDSIATPVLLSRVDRVGGEIPSGPPSETLTKFNARVDSSYFVDITTETSTNTEYSSNKTNNNSSSKTSNGYSSTKKPAAKAYRAPARKTTTTTTRTSVFAAGGYDGPNYLTYRALRAIGSRQARESLATRGIQMPPVQELDIHLLRLRAGSYVSVTSETKNNEAGESTDSLTFGAVNFIRVRGAATPKRP